MMYNSVTEVGCKHLTKFGTGNDEAGARGWFVGPVLDLQCKLEKVFFEMRPVLCALWGC